MSFRAQSMTNHHSEYSGSKVISASRATGVGTENILGVRKRKRVY